ncbi:MAG: pilus assembly protein PilM [Planctomycetota bacterium]|jgi:type IV pilus assembly protein PilM
MISWQLKAKGQQPIGLDIGHNSIKMIQLAMDGGRTSVLAAQKIKIAPGVNGDETHRRRFIISAVAQALSENDFRGRDVVSCLPSERLKITSLRLSEPGSEAMEVALRKEAAQRFGLDPDQDSINYVVAGEVRQDDDIKTELILFAVDNDSIRKHLELLEEATLRPVGVDALPCALFRSFERSLQRLEDRERTAVFVDIGSRFTTVVFSRGPEISFVKQIRIGENDFDEEVVARLGVGTAEAELLRGKLRQERSARPDRTGEQDSGPNPCTLDASTRQTIVDAISSGAEKLAKEISLCFRYYTVTFRGKRVERAVFSGGGAYERILLNVLRRQLAVDVELAQPLKGFDMMELEFGSDRRGLLCEWAVAVGLSLKGWKQGESIN